MNALAWTALVIGCLVAAAGLTLAFAWCNDRWHRRRTQDRPADPVRKFRRELVVAAILHSLACAVVGAVAGAMLALGYLADLPPWLR